MKKYVFVLMFLLLAGFIAKNSIFRPAENFHVVDEGKFYRMAQPLGSEIDTLVKERGIKTIINLRGEQKGEWWYDDEAEAAERNGVTLINLPFSSDHVQYKEDWVKYLDALETAEKPILVHCRSGADRTSEASAVYAIEYMGSSKEEAIEKHMTMIRHLHVPLFQPSKHAFIENYQGKDWLRTSYDPCSKEFIDVAGNRCPDERRAELAKAASASASNP